jgi:GNAT superfamily N-acetyltransferase
MKRIVHTRVKGFTIRFADENDSRIVLDMVKELATYEKLERSFEATEKLFCESLFERGVAETLIGEYEGKPVAYAIFFHNFSSFVGRIGIYIEDIYVRPEMRAKNFGQAMFAYIAKLAIERRCGRLEWSCLDWNKPSIAFYKKMGAKRLDDWTMYRLSGDALERMAKKS